MTWKLVSLQLVSFQVDLTVPFAILARLQSLLFSMLTENTDVIQVWKMKGVPSIQ
jgi:hypothetical protein